MDPSGGMTEQDTSFRVAEMGSPGSGDRYRSVVTAVQAVVISGDVRA